MAQYNLGTARGTIKISASGLSQAAASLQKLGLGLIGVGGLAVAGFGVAVKQAADFEKIMSGAQSALGATNAEMEIVKKTALDLGENSIYGAKNVGKAIEALAYAGLTIKEITNGAAKATIDLAQASGGLIDLDTAGTTVVNTMRTFGLSAKDATHIADELAGAANRSTIDIRDIVTSLRYVGPVANSAGIGLDSVSQALALLGDRGIRGSTAGTSLRGVMLGLISSSKPATKELEKLGIITEDGANIMFDASGKMKDFAEIAQILQDHTRGLTQQEKEHAFAVIFQRRAMASALVIAEAGKKGFQHYAEEIKKGGSASQIAATRLNNLHGDISLLKSKVESTLIRAGTPFQEMLRGWVQALTKLVTAFSKLSPKTQAFILKALALGGAILIAAGSFAFIVGTLIKAYRAFRDLQAAIRLVSGAVKLFTTSLLTNPVFLIIAAIVLLVIIFVVLWIKVEGFRNFWKRTWEIIKNAATTAWAYIYPALVAIAHFFVDTLPKAIQGFWQAFQRGWDKVTNAVVGAWHFIYPILQGIVRWFSSEIIAPVRRFAGFIGHQLVLVGRYFNKNVMPVIRAFGELFAAIFERAKQAFNIWWKIVGPILKEFGIIFRTGFQVAIDIVKIIIANIRTFGSFMIAWFTLIAGIVRGVWEPIWAAIKLVVSVTLAQVQGFFNVFMTAVRAVWGPFWNIIKAVVQGVWGIIKGVIAAALQIIKGIIQVATGLISGHWGKVWQGIKNIFGGVWNAIVTIVGGALGILWSIIVNVITAIINFFKTMPGAVLRAIGNVVRTLWQKGADLVQGLWNGIRRIWDTVWEFLTGLPHLIVSAIKNPLKILWDIGKKIIQGLLDGIKAGIGAVKDFVGGIASSLVSWKGPPSYDKTILVENGRLIMQGLTKGIALGLPGVKKVLQDASKLMKVSAPALNASVIGAGAGGGLANPSLSTGGDTYNFDFKFGDNTSPETVEKAKKDMKDPKALQHLVRAVRSKKKAS